MFRRAGQNSGNSDSLKKISEAIATLKMIRGQVSEADNESINSDIDRLIKKAEEIRANPSIRFEDTDIPETYRSYHRQRNLEHLHKDLALVQQRIDEHWKHFYTLDVNKRSEFINHNKEFLQDQREKSILEHRIKTISDKDSEYDKDSDAPEDLKALQNDYTQKKEIYIKFEQEQNEKLSRLTDSFSKLQKERSALWNYYDRQTSPSDWNPADTPYFNNLQRIHNIDSSMASINSEAEKLRNEFNQSEPVRNFLNVRDKFESYNRSIQSESERLKELDDVYGKINEVNAEIGKHEFGMENVKNLSNNNESVYKANWNYKHNESLVNEGRKKLELLNSEKDKIINSVPEHERNKFNLYKNNLEIDNEIIRQKGFYKAYEEYVDQHAQYPNPPISRDVIFQRFPYLYKLRDKAIESEKAIHELEARKKINQENYDEYQRDARDTKGANPERQDTAEHEIPAYEAHRRSAEEESWRQMEEQYKKEQARGKSKRENATQEPEERENDMFREDIESLRSEFNEAQKRVREYIPILDDMQSKGDWSSPEYKAAMKEFSKSADIRDDIQKRISELENAERSEVERKLASENPLPESTQADSKRNSEEAENIRVFNEKQLQDEAARRLASQGQRSPSIPGAEAAQEYEADTSRPGVMREPAVRNIPSPGSRPVSPESVQVEDETPGHVPYPKNADAESLFSDNDMDQNELLAFRREAEKREANRLAEQEMRNRQAEIIAAGRAARQKKQNNPENDDIDQQEKLRQEADRADAEIQARMNKIRSDYGFPMPGQPVPDIIIPPSGGTPYSTKDAWKEPPNPVPPQPTAEPAFVKPTLGSNNRRQRSRSLGSEEDFRRLPQDYNPTSAPFIRNLAREIPKEPSVPVYNQEGYYPDNEARTRAEQEEKAARYEELANRHRVRQREINGITPAAMNERRPRDNRSIGGVNASERYSIAGDGLPSVPERGKFVPREPSYYPSGRPSFTIGDKPPPKDSFLRSSFSGGQPNAKDKINAGQKTTLSPGYESARDFVIGELMGHAQAPFFGQKSEDVIAPLEREHELARKMAHNIEINLPNLHRAEDLNDMSSMSIPDNLHKYMAPFQTSMQRVLRTERENYLHNILPALENKYLSVGQHGSLRYRDELERAEDAHLRRMHDLQGDIIEKAHRNGVQDLNMDASRFGEAAGREANFGNYKLANKILDQENLNNAGNIFRAHKQEHLNHNSNQLLASKYHVPNQMAPLQAALQGSTFPQRTEFERATGNPSLHRRDYFEMGAPILGNAALSGVNAMMGGSQAAHNGLMNSVFGGGRSAKTRGPNYWR